MEQASQNKEMPVKYAKEHKKAVASYCTPHRLPKIPQIVWSAAACCRFGGADFFCMPVFGFVAM